MPDLHLLVDLALVIVAGAALIAALLLRSRLERARIERDALRARFDALQRSTTGTIEELRREVESLGRFRDVRDATAAVDRMLKATVTLQKAAARKAQHLRLGAEQEAEALLTAARQEAYEHLMTAQKKAEVHLPAAGKEAAAIQARARVETDRECPFDEAGMPSSGIWTDVEGERDGCAFGMSAEAYPGVDQVWVRR